MGDLLKDGDMDQLEQWMGTGPKTFTLLYKISTDGCNAATFHQKCDNQGPTVTVLYNQQGTVYGGYTSQSWTSSDDYYDDGNAYLFRLHFNGKSNPVKIARNGNGNDVYDAVGYGPTFGGNHDLPSENEEEFCDYHGFGYRGYGNRFNGRSIKMPWNGNEDGVYDLVGYGPTFGGGHDLHTFSGAINNSGGYFALNGRLNIGNSYDSQGLQANDINNSNMNVTDLEVYKVADGKRKPKVVATVEPWRKTPNWNEKLLDKLMEDVISFKPFPELKTSQARILMIGPVGAGKSSFFNTINSIFRGRITQRANSGSADQSLTTTYTQYEVRVRSGAALNFRLCDTRGLEESQGLDVLECNYLLDGHVPDFYQFNPATPISPETAGFISKPSLSDRIHCVAFVMDATTLDVVSAKVLQKMKQFQSLMNQKGIPQAVILTKVDRLSKDVEKNTSNTFKSKAVYDIVEKASETLGLPRGNVLPVKNYENEMELDGKINILALLALRQMLNFAEDHMENLLDKVNAEQRGLRRLNIRD